MFLFQHQKRKKHYIIDCIWVHINKTIIIRCGNASLTIHLPRWTDLTCWHLKVVHLHRFTVICVYSSGFRRFGTYFRSFIPYFAKFKNEKMLNPYQRKTHRKHKYKVKHLFCIFLSAILFEFSQSDCLED